METHITVDLDRCQGHGKCYLLADRVFAPIEDDDWGKAEALFASLDDGNDPDGSLRKEAVTGERACPESAIRLTTTETSETPQPSRS